MAAMARPVPQRCKNCEIEFEWPAASGPMGPEYCCEGCAAGGPCTCTYEAIWERVAPADRSAGRPSGRPPTRSGASRASAPRAVGARAGNSNAQRAWEVRHDVASRLPALPG